MEPPYHTRLTQVQQQLGRRLAAVLVSSPENVFYLTGFTGSSGWLWITHSQAYFLTDSRYAAVARQTIPSGWQVQSGRLTVLLGKLYDQGVIAFEANHLTVAQLETLQEKVGGTWEAYSGYLEQLRRVKDAAEQATLVQAARLADEALEVALRQVRPGVTERHLVWGITEYFYQHGAEVSFPPIVASGLRGAFPHAEPTDKKLQVGELLTLDLGARWQGYCSDLTRTVCLGAATAKQRERYALVWQAYQAGCDALRPGVSAGSVDAAARAVLTEAGFGTLFTHATGHGVGIAIHEEPRLARAVRTRLQAGMVVTCEPGLYEEGWGGIRIEDTLLVTETGSKRLTKAENPAQVRSIPFA